LAVEWTANPGAGAKVRTAFKRVVAAPGTGQYIVTMDATNTFIPNILFKSGDAPTTYDIVLQWLLVGDQVPVFISA
jgi:hypothetical protein